MTPPGEHELALESRVDDARSTYRFRTADGVHSKSSFRDGDLLLAEELWDVPTGRLLCPEANYGVVGTVLADATADVEMTESSARAAGSVAGTRPETTPTPPSGWSPTSVA